jgi:hypothetical protein
VGKTDFYVMTNSTSPFGILVEADNANHGLHTVPRAEDVAIETFGIQHENSGLLGLGEV